MSPKSEEGTTKPMTLPAQMPEDAQAGPHQLSIEEKRLVGKCLFLVPAVEIYACLSTQNISLLKTHPEGLGTQV